MQKYSYFLGVVWLGFALMSVPARAAQLDGLALEKTGDKIQVILDTEISQPVRVDRQVGSQTTLFLPKAKLPTAFQGTGLPPIRSAEAGVTAHVVETPEGLCIYLNSAKPNHNFYEISFKKGQPPAVAAPSVTPPALPMPAMRQRPPAGLPMAQAPTPAKASPIAAQPVQQWRPRRVTPPVPKVVARVAPSPVVVPVRKAAPVVVKARSPIVMAQKPVTPIEPVASKTVPSAKLASVPETGESGYNLLEHAGEPTVSTLPAPKTEKPQVSPRPVPGGQVLPKVLHNPYLLKASQNMTPAIWRWVIASLLLLGGTLLAATLVATWLRKRMGGGHAGLYGTHESRVPPETEYFVPPPEPATPEPETFQDYLAQSQRETLEGDKPLEGPPAKTTSETVPPEAVETPPPAPPKTGMGVPGSLLFQPPRSFRDAIASPLSTHPSPNVSAPFGVLKPTLSTEGGPPPKQPPGPSETPFQK